MTSRYLDLAEQDKNEAAPALPAEPPPPVVPDAPFGWDLIPLPADTLPAVGDMELLPEADPLYVPDPESFLAMATALVLAVNAPQLRRKSLARGQLMRRNEAAQAF